VVLVARVVIGCVGGWCCVGQACNIRPETLRRVFDGFRLGLPLLAGDARRSPPRW